MTDALAVLPPKVRAGIYLLLIVANAVVTPLMAAGTIPSLYGTVVLSLLNVFGGATALANVKADPPNASYDPKHD